jgi:bis(5'-nucleosidyl)-tetraphosphatase
MARNQRSAGVIVYRRDPATKQRLFLLLDYGKHWDFPKGHVEKGEDDRTAALREVDEETGIKDVELEPEFSHLITYFFRDRAKQLIRKDVIFFLGETRTEEVKLSHEHSGFAFLPYEPALKRATYPKAKEVLRKAQERLAQEV